jgi:chemotaxis protein MotB
MVKKRHNNDDGGPSSSWMDTYGDMVTLLLTFFVMLFAMSTIDVEKFEQIIKSIRGSIGIMYQGKTIKSQESSIASSEYEIRLSEIIERVYPNQDIEDVQTVIDDMQLQNKEMEDTYEKIKQYVLENNVTEMIVVTNEKQGILIRFKENALFDSGKADLKEDAKVLLSELIDILSEISRDIRVEGHTDNIPIHNKDFESNWELSAQRAANVVKFFIEKGMDPLRLSLSGYSEYHPVSGNDTAEGRQKNRRVDILVLRDNIEDDLVVNEGDID